jgi:type II secretory pathway component PulK
MALGVEKEQRDIITDSLEDWRDTNDTRRLNGAESDDYLQSATPYRARNANLQDVAELLQIRGITPELYYGAGDQPGLVDLVTVRSRGTLDINTAPKLVLKAAGLLDAEIDDIFQSRAAAPYGTVPARYTARGGSRFTVGSATFRIEAEGLIAGQPRARLVAIVQRTVGPQTGSAPTLTVYSWRPLPPRPPATPGADQEGASKG